MNKKGITLIELLIGMVMMTILFSALYITITTLYQGQIRERSKAIVSGDINTSILLLDKLIRSTGFGISKDNLSDAFSVDNTINKVEFYTLMGFQTESGAWEVCPDNGNRVSEYPAVVLSDKKELKGFLNKGEVRCDPGTIIYKCKVDSDNSSKCDDPYFYIHTLKRSDNTTSSCYPSAKNLILDNWPILNCVYDFRIEYDDNKKLLKLGFLVQNGKRDVKRIVKTYEYTIFTNNNINIDNEDEFYHYRWTVVEDIIFLENLK